MRSGNGLRPTMHPVYLQKKTNSNSKKTKTSSPLIIQAKSSSDEGAGGSSPYQYVIAPKSSSDKKKDTQAQCTCGGNCGKESTKASGSEKKTCIYLKSGSKAHCTCNGSHKDGWLCDICRAAEKKKGVWKFLSCTSDSDSETGACCCNHCGSCAATGSRDDADARFAQDCDEWMKKSAKKMKKARKGRVICNCHNAGCKMCVIVKC